MIHTGAQLLAAAGRRTLELACDLCVIGSGAGGAPVAWRAARAGAKVVVLEAGGFWRPRDFTGVEYDMLPRLYMDAAARTTADRRIHVHQGKGVGGSTLHNLNLIKRLPREIGVWWAKAHGLGALVERLADRFSEAEELLGVRTLTALDLNANNDVLRRGCEALGWRGAFLRDNRTGCRGSGFCELGCPFDAKNNALKVFMAQAIEAGATVCAETWAERVEHDGRRVHGVRAEVRPVGSDETLQLRVRARAVCVAASATGTPALLLRSEVPDPNERLGSRLFLHPGTAVAGRFPERLRSWTGVPQSYECTEWLDFADESERRVWIVPAFAHPAGVSASLGAFGSAGARLMNSYPYLAALSPMVHDLDAGRVRPRGRFGLEIAYRLGADDRAQLALGVRAAARLLFAAGAEEVWVPTMPLTRLEHEREIETRLADSTLDLDSLDVTSVHPMSGAWLDADPGRGCTRPDGRYHHLEGLWISDTSLFPTSIGVPPQLTAYALGLEVGAALLSTL